MSFTRKLIYKVYQEDDTYLGVLDDVISDLSIRKEVNGGDSEFTITLARKIDDFEEDTIVKFNNRIKVYLQDEYNLAGDKLVAYGYIVSYKPYLQGKDEHVEVVCLSAVSKLKNSFYRTGTAAAASDLGVELTSKRADEMCEAIIDHYRLIETNSMLSNDYSNSDSTPDNSGGAITFDHRFFNMKHLDALREVSKFLPRNKSGGYFFYWRISTDGKLYVKNIATTAEHTFIIGKHISEISGHKSIEEVNNRVVFWNEKGTSDPDYIKLTSDDVTSQNNYDIMSSYITDSKITNAAAASLLTSSRVYDKKDPIVKIKLTLNSEYDLSSITPGQTCQILNAKNNPFAIGADTVLFIHSVEYRVDAAVVEMSNAQERFEDMVEEERIRLDQEMTWYGRITQQINAAQLSPANRVWTTTIVFSATTGADAYRQIDWSAGTIYIPAGASGTAAKRVIHIGNTGLMSPGSIYYIYLDEGTLPTASAVVTRTGTSKQGGDILADDGSPGWSNDQYKGYVVEIGGQKKLIKSNTASILTLEDRWTVADQSSQTFTISKLTLSVTDSEETAMSDNRIVFTNAAANANTDSDAVLTPGTGSDIIVDGETQIAQHSIVAANLITTQALITASAQINSAVIQDAHITGTITVSHTDAQCTNALADQTSINTSNDTSNVNGTASSTVATGANRGYNGLNGSYQILKGFLSSGLDATLGLPTNGIRIDNRGIYGRASGVTTFSISSLGSAYFRGTIAATAGYIGGTSDGWVITSGYIKSSDSHIELKGSTTPHIKAIYNSSNYVQMTAAGNVPRFDVIKSGVMRMRLSGDGLYFYDTSGNQKARIYGSSTTLKDLYFDTNYAYFAGDIISGDDIDLQGEVIFGPGETYNMMSADGTHIVFDGTSAYHIIPTGNAGTASQVGTSTHEWYSVWALDTSINHDDLAEAEKVHPLWQLSKVKLEETIRKSYQLQNDKIIEIIKHTHYKPIKSRLTKLKTSKAIRQEKIKGILADTTNENFDIKKKRASKITLGTVVIISNEGCLPSNKKGQTNILGVVSTQPGIKLDSHAEGIYIAKVGKVPCRAVGQCQAGDLLQTSDIEGCAEKVENPKTGSIIGRAKETKTTNEEEKIKIEVQMM